MIGVILVKIMRPKINMMIKGIAFVAVLLSLFAEGSIEVFSPESTIEHAEVIVLARLKKTYERGYEIEIESILKGDPKMKSYWLDNSNVGYHMLSMDILFAGMQNRKSIYLGSVDESRSAFVLWFGEWSIWPEGVRGPTLNYLYYESRDENVDFIKEVLKGDFDKDKYQGKGYHSLPETRKQRIELEKKRKKDCWISILNIRNNLKKKMFQK